MIGIGPELPLSRDNKNGLYSLVQSYKEETKQNFKNLLLTSPGERVMNADFGVGLKHFLFEPKVNVIPKIRQAIRKQANRYMPFVDIIRISFDSGESGEHVADSQILSIQIEYEVPSLNLVAEIILHAEDIG
jgi:phage baseplate assembly protein W